MSTSPVMIGRVVATEEAPNTPHAFHFWTALDATVGIGTIVRVVGTHPLGGVIPTVYGVVVEGFSYNDLASPLDDVQHRGGAPSAPDKGSASRTEIRLYTAAVLRQLPEEPLQPVPLGEVFLADEADIACALRMDTYLREGARTGIPIGLYHAGGTKSPIYVDADYLLGPEAAHLTITGVSGLATKTSAVEWLLASIFAHFPEQKGSIAAVCFNVKGPDLCFLDYPATMLDAQDLEIYEKLGVPAKPFERVKYFAPYTPDGFSLNTLRSNEALADNVIPLRWGLKEVLEFAPVLLNKDDIDAKADAVIDFIDHNVIGRKFTDRDLSRTHLVRSFADLEDWFADVLQSAERENRESWRTHHVATLRKVRNRLTNIAQRCAGLVATDSAVSDLPWGSFEDRTVYVINVANLEEDAQDLVFTRVVSTLRQHLERRDLGVKHVVVFVDELNRYAPNDGQETYVRKMLLDIAERGRYLGLVLFGAQQFRSQVHRRVVGNAGTSIFGRMDGDELATAGYNVLSPAIKTKLATLDKGQLMVRHPHFTQPVFIKFPRPAVLSGREGVERFPQAAPLSLEEATTRFLCQMDPTITLSWVKETIVLASDEEVNRARTATQIERPRNVRAFFKSQFRNIVPMTPVARPVGVTPLRKTPANDPYEL